MKVLYFSPSQTGHDLRFLKAIVAAEFEVVAVCLAAPKGPGPDGVRTVSLTCEKLIEVEGFDDLLKLMPEFERLIQCERPDILHAGPLQSCAWMAALSGFHPFLAVSWGFDVLRDVDRAAEYAWAASLAIRSSDAFFCDCDSVRHRASTLGLGDKSVIQFPWGVDVDQFAPGRLGRIRSGWGWEDKKIVICVRSWEPLYRMDTVLQAFAFARERNPNLRLALLGSGSQAKEIQRKARELGIEPYLKYCGIVGSESLPDYYHSADIYISCSEVDGSSVSLLEAMGTGLPAVVSDIPSNREWIEPDQSGWLCPVGDSRRFSEAITTAAAMSTDERESMGACGRNQVLKRADWGRNIQLLFDAYHLLAEKTG